jgi:hypothetical protein
LDRWTCFIDHGLKQDGREPDKLFSDMSKYSRLSSLQKSLGSGPSKLFLDKLIALRFEKLPFHVGSMPEN